MDIQPSQHNDASSQTSTPAPHSSINTTTADATLSSSNATVSSLGTQRPVDHDTALPSSTRRPPNRPGHLPLLWDLSEPVDVQLRSQTRQGRRSHRDWSWRPPVESTESRTERRRQQAGAHLAAAGRPVPRFQVGDRVMVVNNRVVGLQDARERYPEEMATIATAHDEGDTSSPESADGQQQVQEATPEHGRDEGPENDTQGSEEVQEDVIVSPSRDSTLDQLAVTLEGQSDAIFNEFVHRLRGGADSSRCRDEDHLLSLLDGAIRRVERQPIDHTRTSFVRDQLILDGMLVSSGLEGPARATRRSAILADMGGLLELLEEERARRVGIRRGRDPIDAAIDEHTAEQLAEELRSVSDEAFTLFLNRLRWWVDVPGYWSRDVEIGTLRYSANQMAHDPDSHWVDPTFWRNGHFLNHVLDRESVHGEARHRRREQLVSSMGRLADVLNEEAGRRREAGTDLNASNVDNDWQADGLPHFDDLPMLIEPQRVSHGTYEQRHARRQATARHQRVLGQSRGHPASDQVPYSAELPQLTEPHQLPYGTYEQRHARRQATARNQRVLRQSRRHPAADLDPEVLAALHDVIQDGAADSWAQATIDVFPQDDQARHETLLRDHRTIVLMPDTIAHVYPLRPQRCTYRSSYEDILAEEEAEDRAELVDDEWLELSEAGRRALEEEGCILVR